MLRAMDAAPKFSWKTASKHAGWVFLVAVVACVIAFAFAPDHANMRKLGEGAGRVIFIALLVGLGGSYLLQTGRRRQGQGVLGLSVAIVLAVPAVAVVAAASSGGGEHALLNSATAGKATLVATPEGTLRHPTLGFEIGALSEGAVENHEAAQKQMGSPRTHVWAWSDADRGELTIVSLEIGVELSGLDDYLDGAWKGFSQLSADRGSGLGPVEAAGHHARLASFGEGTVGLRVEPLSHKDLPFAVAIAVIRSNRDDTLDALNGLEVPAPGPQE
jgi:hypothetical protein